MNKEILIQKIKDNFPKLIFDEIEVILSDNKTVAILDKKVVFSFFTNSEIEKQFRVEVISSLELENRITLPIPHYKYVAMDSSFAGYDYISGLPLSLQEFNGLDLEQKDVIAGQLSIFLGELHAFPLSVAKKIGIDFGRNEDDIRKNCAKNIEVLKSKLTQDEFDFIKKIFDFCSSQKIERFKKCVVHDDVSSNNIFFDKNTAKVCGVIDFENIQISDPAVDFYGFWEYGESFVDKVLYGYDLSDTGLKERSYRWFVYKSLDDMIYGLEVNRSDFWEKGYKMIKLLKMKEQ